MTVKKQVKIMLAQLSNFDSLWEKMRYLTMMFAPDPEFTQEARDIVRGEISKELNR